MSETLARLNFLHQAAHFLALARAGTEHDDALPLVARGLGHALRMTAQKVPLRLCVSPFYRGRLYTLSMCVC